MLLWGADGAPGMVLKGHSPGVRSLAWSPDGTRLASAGLDGTVRLWGADGTPGPILKGHTLPVLAWPGAPTGGASPRRATTGPCDCGGPTARPARS